MHVTRTIEFAGNGTCSVAVVSDTHGKPHPNLLPLLEARRPSLILHAGDVGGLAVIDALAKIGQTVYVRGNVDPAGPAWPDSVSLHLGLGSSWLDVLLLHIALARMKLNRTALDLIHRHPAQAVVFGHSHTPFLGMHGKVGLFNPGSAGPARWGLPITMGWMEVSPGGLGFRHLDLPTGQVWKPGQKV